MSATGHLPGWIRRRLTPGSALGLPLTAGVVLVLTGAWAFGQIADNVVEREDLVARDGTITAWLVAHRVDWLTDIMRVLTHLGAFWLAVPLVALVALRFPGPWGRGRSVACVITVTAGTSLLVNVVKVLIARPRPTLAEVVATAAGYAFPSGHSGQAAAAYGVLAYLISRRLPPRRRPVVWAAATVIVLLVGFSRVYLGVHWLTDVVGGYLVGTVWLASVLTAATAYGEVRRAGAARRARATRQEPATPAR